MTELECQNLAVGYAGHPVADGITFSLAADDCLCIIGGNGSGKSTLLKTLLRQLPPVSGTLRFGRGFAPGRVGYVAQHTPVQTDFPATVWEVVASGLQAGRWFHPWLTQAERNRADRALARLGMTGDAGRSYHRLSGGQQQRVLLARALCATDGVLLLDEPTAGLDAESSAVFHAHIRELLGQGILVIMATHDFHAARKLATRILRLGAIPTFCPADEFSLEEGLAP